MNPEQASVWRAAMQAFDAWLELEDDADARARLLTELDARDPGLRRQVQRLIDADQVRTASTVDAAGARRSVDSHDAAPPSIPGYRALALLGRGGMGEVWQAERIGEGYVQQVALKCLRADLGQGQMHARFLSERQILARLEHRHIARLLDAGIDQAGRPWMAMELVRGETICRYAEQRALPIAARLRLFVDVCAAISDAHRHFVVHCDLKPSNVLVDADGQVKVLDFGIARLVAPGDGEATLINAMTPAYAAPEQLLGEPVSVATDVYALGLLLRELLVGSSANSDLRQRMREITGDEEQAQLPSALVLAEARALADPERVRWARHLRGDLDQIVAKALQREPGQRYADVVALAQDVEAFLDGRPVAARAYSWRDRSGKFLRRHRLAVLAALVTLVALSFATIWSWRAASNERQARAQAESALHAAELAAKRAENTKDFVVSMIKDIRPLEAARGQGTAYTAAQWLADSGKRVADGLSESPDVQAPLQVAMAQALLQLNELDAADAELKRALQALDKAPDEAMHAEALLYRARIAIERKQLPEARRDAAESLRIFSGIGGDDAIKLRISVRTTLAKIASLEHDLAGAETQYLAILRDRAQVLNADDAPELAVDWNNLGANHALRGQYPEAEQAYRRAMELFAKGAGAEHPRMAWLHFGLGMSLFGRGERVEAADELAKAADLLARKLSPQHPLLARIYGAQGLLAVEQGDFESAADFFERSRALDPPSNRSELIETELRLLGLAWRVGRETEADQHLRSASDLLAEAAIDPQEPALFYIRLARALAGQRAGVRADADELAALQTELATRWPPGHLRAREAQMLIDAAR